MAIARTGEGIFVPSGTHTTVDETEIIQSGTTLSILTVHCRQSIDVTETPTWDAAGANEDYTLVRDVGGSGAGDNSRIYVYGLVSPTAGTKIVDYTIDSNNYFTHTITNYSGTVTTSVADAIKFISEDVNNNPGTTGVHASGGTSGNTLFLACTHSNLLGDPMSNNASFTEIQEGDVNNGGSTLSYYICEDLAGAPSAVTVTYNNSDQNASGLFEIVPAASTTILPMTARHYLG